MLLFLNQQKTSMKIKTNKGPCVKADMTKKRHSNVLTYSRLEISVIFDVKQMKYFQPQCQKNYHLFKRICFFIYKTLKEADHLNGRTNVTIM